MSCSKDRAAHKHNQPHALNPAIAVWFQFEYHWRGVSDAGRSASKHLVKAATTLLTLALLLNACSPGEEQASDSELRQKLTGTWIVEVRDPDGSSSTKGTWTVAADDSYTSELSGTVSNELRTTTLQGYIQVRNGFLIETTTNAIPHWIPEVKRGRLPPEGATSRIKIVRLDDHELVIETNQFGSVLYTKKSK